MDSLKTFLQEALYSFSAVKIIDILDILIVAFILYRIILVVHSSSASRVARAIIMLLFATLVTSALDMHLMYFLLSRILELGVIALVILFQPELRRALERFGGRYLKDFVGNKPQRSNMEEAILATVSACEVLSKERVGMLMVFEREVSLESYAKSGTLIDAQISEQLLRNLFFPKASLHDGAVILRGGRVAAAGCVMPLSENSNLSSDLGTRHRAGVGASEVSDAVVVIVSEETGTISVAVGGMLKRHLAPKMLERLLANELLPKENTNETFTSKIKNLFVKKEHADAE